MYRKKKKKTKFIYPLSRLYTVCVHQSKPIYTSSRPSCLIVISINGGGGHRRWRFSRSRICRRFLCVWIKNNNQRKCNATTTTLQNSYDDDGPHCDTIYSQLFFRYYVVHNGAGRTNFFLFSTIIRLFL